MLINKSLSIVNQTRSREIKIGEYLEITKTPQNPIILERMNLINQAYLELYNPKGCYPKNSKVGRLKIKTFKVGLSRVRDHLNKISPAVRENIDIMRRDKKQDIDVVFSGIPFFCMETNTAYLLKDSLLLSQGDKLSANKYKKFISLLKTSDPLMQSVDSIKIINIRANNFTIQNH